MDIGTWKRKIMKILSKKDLWEGLMADQKEMQAQKQLQVVEVDDEYEKIIHKYGREEDLYPESDLIVDYLPELEDDDEPDEMQLAVITEDKDAKASRVAAVEKETMPAVVPQSGENKTLDRVEPLDPKLFPDQAKGGKSKTPTTIANVAHILARYGITVRYDVIKKNCDILIPGLACLPDNADNVALTCIKDLVRLNDMSTQPIDEIILAIADRTPYNPVADWISSKHWDGIDRFEELCATLTVTDGYPKHLMKQLLFRWLLSAIAAMFMTQGFKARGVLTFQGRQSIGKTSWIAALIPCGSLRDMVLKLDHHMDAGDKDAKISALLHWIVEIGELDGSFRKDIARLKGFITSDSDKIRIPYAKSPSNFPRRTVFCATVNDSNFLVDDTGNSRWWTISVLKINYQHNINMQQLWAQMKVEYDRGEQWWLTKDEEEALEQYNYDNHRTVSSIEETLVPRLDLDRIGEDGLDALTATEVLHLVGIKYAKNGQARECGTLLRKHLGPPKKIKGAQKWRVPFAKDTEFNL